MSVFSGFDSHYIFSNNQELILFHYYKQNMSILIFRKTVDLPEKVKINYLILFSVDSVE